MMKSDRRAGAPPLVNRLFLDHPAMVGETYWEHMGVATGFGIRMLLGGLACLVHAILPCLCVTTGSAQVRHLYARMVTNRAADPAMPKSPGREPAPARDGSAQDDGDVQAAVSTGPARLLAGGLLCAMLAAIAVVTAPRFMLPPMLVVLVLGILVRIAAPRAVGWCAAGVRFCAKHVLQVGVALLGLRLVLGDLAMLGMPAIVIVLISITVTIGSGFLLGRLLGQPGDTTAISATSVAICGASAALAAAATVPSRPGLQRETGVIIVAVSLLGTAVMVLYPWLAHGLGLDPLQMSILFGASIHDVAQVAGAGMTISPEVAAQAVTVKMIRVACLLPVVLMLGWQFRRGKSETRSAIPPLPIPPFLIAFVALAALASSGLLSGAMLGMGQQAATWALAVAVAAIGLNTSPADMRNISPAMLVALVGQTLIQLGTVILLIRLSL